VKNLTGLLLVLWAVGCAREPLAGPLAPSFDPNRLPAGYAWPPIHIDGDGRELPALRAPLARASVSLAGGSTVSIPETPPPYFAHATSVSADIPSGAACLDLLMARGIAHRVLDERRGVETPIAAGPVIGGVRYTTPGGGELIADCRLAAALERIGPELLALGVSEVIFSGAYSYRFTRTGKLSLHGRGLAIDIHRVVANGETLSVKTDFARGRGDGCDRESPLLNRVACRLRALGLFRELITPDHDADHHDHLHLGIAAREPSSGQHVVLAE
jgi:hypothetical protein